MTREEVDKALKHADGALMASSVEMCYSEVRLFFAAVRQKLAELQRKEKGERLT